MPRRQALNKRYCCYFTIFITRNSYVLTNRASVVAQYIIIVTACSNAIPFGCRFKSPLSTSNSATALREAAENCPSACVFVTHMRPA